METKTFLFDFKDLNLVITQIEDVMGYREGEDRTIVTKLIGEVLKEAENVCRIKAQYTIFRNVKFDSESRSVNIDNVNFQIKKIVYGQLKKADFLAVFVCTAGGEIGNLSKNAMKDRDLLKGYVYDVVGSEIVEAAGDLMQRELENMTHRSGLKITNRFSPGYCGWDVAEQHKLFSLIPENFCGIKLTESALMDPVKSISGFIGIGENVKMIPYTCSLCDMKECFYRKHSKKETEL